MHLASLFLVSMTSLSRCLNSHLLEAHNGDWLVGADLIHVKHL